MCVFIIFFCFVLVEWLAAITFCLQKKDQKTFPIIFLIVIFDVLLNYLYQNFVTCSTMHYQVKNLWYFSWICDSTCLQAGINKWHQQGGRKAQFCVGRYGKPVSVGKIIFVDLKATRNICRKFQKNMVTI